ncbi:MAG: MATE family efflux transporter, partial [Candidatus Rokuibacteriota bacterium]
MVEALARVGFITFDAYYVAWLGPESLAGISLVFPPFILMQTMSAGGMGGGVASAIARALGAGRRAEADALVTHAVVTALVMAAAFTAAGWLYGPALYRLMGGAGGTLAAAVTYSHVMAAGSVAVWLMNTLANVVRGTGNMIVPAGAIVVGGVVHVTLAPALILGWGPLPCLGVAGAATAAIASYAMGSLILLWYLISGRGLVRLTAVGQYLQRRLFSDILAVGLPSSLATIQFQLINFVMVGAIGRFGTPALAGYGAATRLEMVQVPVIFGFGSALVAMVGTNVGAGQVSRARRVAWLGTLIGAVIGGGIGMLGAVFPEAWMARFASESEVINIG